MILLPGICSAFATLAILIVSIILCFQFGNIHQRLKLMMGLWALLVAVYAALYFVFGGASLKTLEHLVAFANGLLIYLLAFLTFCYCYFVSDHSLSVLYMMALEERPDRRLSHEQLLELFPYDKLLKPRMLDLIEGQLVVLKGEHYELTPKGRLRAKIAGTLKQFLNLEPGG